MTQVGRPHPLAPSPRHEPIFVASSILLGEGEGFFKGDGGGSATPIPFETLTPLSATLLGLETSRSAERGVWGVRRTDRRIHPLEYPPPPEEG